MGGSIVCVGGKPVPCTWRDKLNPEYDELIRNCWLKHEESHAEDAEKGNWCDPKKCPNKEVPLLANDTAVRSECKAYKALWDCIKTVGPNGARPIGWFKAKAEIDRFLKENPGKCEKEFPGGFARW